MKINPQLVNWLKRNIASDTDRIAIYENGNLSLEREMILTCLHAGLIEFGEYTGDVIYYQLTPQGEILLERTDPATEPLATPPTGAREAEGVPEICVTIYEKGGYDVEVRENFNGKAGDTRYVVSYASDPVTWLDNAKDAIAYVDARVNPATPPTESVGTGDVNDVATLQLKLAQSLYALDDAKNELAAARERIAELTGELPSGRNDSIELSNDVAATDKLLAESEAMITKLTAENNRLQDAIDKAHSHIINAHDTIPKNINGTGYIMDALEAIEAVLPD